MQNVINFSGGKDSTAMLLMMLERGMKVDRVIYVDTTKEFPQMYAHIEKVQSMIAPLKIEVIKLNFDYWFSEHVVKTGKYAGCVGRGWPAFNYRWCTGLKIKAMSYINHKESYNPRIEKLCAYKNLDIIRHIGIAYDEKHRTLRDGHADKIYPLVNWGVTEAQALKYCYDRGLDWGGLYEIFSRVSCWCCPFSKVGELWTLHRKFPELWEKLKEMDKKSRLKFSTAYSVEQLDDRFTHNSLWNFKDCGNK